MTTQDIARRITDHAASYNSRYLLAYDSAGTFVGVIHVDDSYPAGGGPTGFRYAVSGATPLLRVRRIVEEGGLFGEGYES